MIAPVRRSLPPLPPAAPRCSACSGAGLAVLALVQAAAQVRPNKSRAAIGQGSWTRNMRPRWPASWSARAPGGSRSPTINIRPPPRAASAGLLKAFSGGSGTGAVQGRVVERPVVSRPATPPPPPRRRRSETIRITLAGGIVKEFGIEPEPPVDPDRIPVTDAHRRGVLDPMTGSMLRVAGTGDPLSPESCRAATGDLRRPDALRSEARFQAHGNRQGREGLSAARRWSAPSISRRSPATSPIAPRSNISIAQRNMEVWLVPIAGTRVLVPFRLKIPTPIGNAVLEATQFVTAARPRRARPPRRSKDLVPLQQPEPIRHRAVRIACPARRAAPRRRGIMLTPGGVHRTAWLLISRPFHRLPGWRSSFPDLVANSRSLIKMLR